MQNADEIDEITLCTTQSDRRRINIGGTSRVGTLKDTTRNEIIRHFGEPDGPFGKICDQWAIRFADGTVATIYDYHKRNRSIPDDEETDWSIGGRSEDAVELLQYCGLDAQSRTVNA